LGNGPVSHGEIPLQNLTFSQRLNNAGQMTGSISLESSQIPPATLITATTPNKTPLRRHRRPTGLGRPRAHPVV